VGGISAQVAGDSIRYAEVNDLCVAINLAIPAAPVGERLPPGGRSGSGRDLAARPGGEDQHEQAQQRGGAGEVLNSAQQADRGGQEADPDDGQADAEVDDHVEAGQHVSASALGCGLIDGGEPAEEHQALSGTRRGCRDEQEGQGRNRAGGGQQQQSGREQRKAVTFEIAGRPAVARQQA